MRITYLGHSGFIVETAQTIIVMDPWVSPNGAFDAAWFQYPKNHHMADIVRSLLSSSDKDKYIYISHEHKDHFDIDFLTSLPNRDFTLVLADFYHSIVKQDLAAINYECKDIISLKNDESLPFKDGSMTLFVIDMELDADSAILVQSDSGTFLNLNDSKPHDQLHAIAEKYSPIDVFSGQFSGAIWHPTCYKMDEKHYEAVCRHKNKSKFKMLAQSLDILKPAVFLPSAGPPCFLDPILFPIQLQKINTYPRARQLLDFLDHHFADNPISTQWSEIMPGDVLDVPTRAFVERVSTRVEDDEFVDYITAYAEEYTSFFAERAKENAKIDPAVVFKQLKKELDEKLECMHLVRQYIQTKLYFALDEYTEAMYCIDFMNNEITLTDNIEDKEQFFSITTPAWQVEKVLSGSMSWADFSLAFRATLQRVPDVYNTLSHAYLTLNTDRLAHFCQLYHDISLKEERITVDSEGSSYSVLRYCPHQGGDLANAKVKDGILVCPRHGWKFDLKNGGKCLHAEASIDATPCESE
ncbi:MAG: Rieske 2Fe-2S domain-containing protein [Gammaproteobacteria bacterium]|nr:Rieske 2Fe-2S domain-containing protein [Gammaproteobacteria bacterium]